MNTFFKISTITILFSFCLSACRDTAKVDSKINTEDINSSIEQEENTIYDESNSTNDNESYLDNEEDLNDSIEEENEEIPSEEDTNDEL